jgi:hypothetical protein
MKEKWMEVFEPVTYIGYDGKGEDSDERES